MMNECCCNDEKTRSELLNEIRQCSFYVNELALYLDTHPDDRRAICLHNECANKLRKITDQYQQIYGPLTINFPCNKWRWLEQPWPWEKGGSF